MQSYGISNVFFHRNTPNCCQDIWLWITTMMVALKETSGNLHSHLTQSMGTRNVCSIIVVHIYSSEPKPHPKAIVWPEDEKRFLLWIRFHGLVHGQWETEDIIRQQTATPPVPPCAVYCEKNPTFQSPGGMSLKANKPAAAREHCGSCDWMFCTFFPLTCSNEFLYAPIV